MDDLDGLFSSVRRGMLFTAVLGAGAGLTACGGGGGGEMVAAPAPGPAQAPPVPPAAAAAAPMPVLTPGTNPTPTPMAGTLSLVAGTTDPGASSDRAIDGTGPGVRFMLAGGISADGRGNVFVADTGANTIRQISASGEVSTLAGTPIATASTNQFFTTFSRPAGMTIDGSGNLYVTDGFTTSSFIVNRYWTSVRKVTPQGEATTLPLPTFVPGIPQPILGPGIAVDGTGSVYLAFAGTIRKFTPAGVMTNVTAPEVTRYTSSLAVDKAGNVYFGYQNTVRKIAPGQAEVVLAGSGAAGYVDGNGVQAAFDFPEYKLVGVADAYLTGLAVDSVGNLYVADSNNFAVRRISPDGRVTTIAGRPGVQQIQLGELPAGLAAPRGLALDGDTTLYVSTATAVLRIDLR